LNDSSEKVLKILHFAEKEDTLKVRKCRARKKRFL